ncbi:hypothetical protein BG000_010004 [Podila horticola]|nr:hypothetical protein BG000_010004 [Podila horticola]
MSRKILLTLTAACCLLSIGPYSLPLSHSSPSISSGFHLTIFAHAKPIQVLVQRSNIERTESSYDKKTSQFEDKTGKQTKSARHAKHNLAYDSILHSESQLPVFWNNHHPPAGKDAKKPLSSKQAVQQRKTHGKERISTVKALLASMFRSRASTTASSPSKASSVKTVTKSDILRKPSGAKKPQLVQQKQEEARAASSILSNAQGQVATSKPKTKKKASAEVLAMIGAAIGAEGSASGAFETAEAICDDSDNDHFVKRAIQQLTHDDHHAPRSDAECADSVPSDTMSISENDSSIPIRKDKLQFLHRGNFVQQDSDSKQEQDKFRPTYQFEEDLEEEGILESFTNALVGPSPADDHDPQYPVSDSDQGNSRNSYFKDWIQYMDRKGAAAFTAVLATLVRLDPSTWSGPQVALAFTFATFVAFVLLALCISYKMHRRRERRLRLHSDASSLTSSSSSFGFFHYLTGGVFDLKRHRQRHSLAALSPFSKETSTYFTLPTYRDAKTAASSVTPDPSYASTATSASVPGANGRSEIRRTSVARQLSISQAQAVQQHAQTYVHEPLHHLPSRAPTF